MYIKKLEIVQGRYHKFSLLVICYAKAARVNKVDKPQPGNNLKQGLRVKNGFTHSEKLLVAPSDQRRLQIFFHRSSSKSTKQLITRTASPARTVRTFTNTESTHALTAGPALDGAITARNFKGFL